MIRQTIRKAGLESDAGWVVETRGECHVYRECWTLGNRRDALKVAREERIELCRIMADEVGG